MASYNLFLELGKVIGATRMLELCELYIARHQRRDQMLESPVADSALDASGARIWRDCSDANPFAAVYPPTWLLGGKISAPMTAQAPHKQLAEEAPGAPKKFKQAFQSPFLAATPPPEEADSPKRRLSFTSLDSMPPLEAPGK